jgi:hypothetical protein
MALVVLQRMRSMHSQKVSDFQKFRFARLGCPINPPVKCLTLDSHELRYSRNLLGQKFQRSIGARQEVLRRQVHAIRPVELLAFPACLNCDFFLLPYSVLQSNIV